MRRGAPKTNTNTTALAGRFTGATPHKDNEVPQYPLLPLWATARGVLTDGDPRRRWGTSGGRKMKGNREGGGGRERRRGPVKGASASMLHSTTTRLPLLRYVGPLHLMAATEGFFSGFSIYIYNDESTTCRARPTSSPSNWDVRGSFGAWKTTDRCREARTAGNKPPHRHRGMTTPAERQH